MSLAVRIILAITLLGTALAAQLARDCFGSWRVVERAEIARRFDRQSSDLLDVAAALAAERGLMNGLLAAPATATHAIQEAIAAQAAKAAAALGAATDGLMEMPDIDRSRLRVALDAVSATGEQVAALRRAAGQATQGRQNAPTQAAWFSAATAYIEAVTRLRQLLDAAANEETVVTRLIAVRDALGTMAEYTGRERGRLNGAIAAKARLTVADTIEIGMLRGRVDGAWNRVLPRLDDLPVLAAGPVRAAGVALFETFAAKRTSVFEAAARGADWPMTAEDWFAAATAAIQAMRAGQVAASEALNVAMAERAALGWQRMIQALVLWGAGLGVGGLAIWYVMRHLVRPLNGAIDVLDGLTEGQLDVAVPLPRGRDEVARLLRATLRFQQMALTNRALEQSQVASQHQAEAARVQAVREIGTLIEHESGEAVREVKGLAEQLAGVATEVRRDVVAIAEASQLATDMAGEGRQQSDAAAEAARGLNTAIQEVARQMETAAVTTRGVVGHTVETRDSFEALFASVTEVREVARLIGDIAARTDLLALNATIEAARAGEAGKGFAVVATEVKSLASQTARSTGQIATRVGAIDMAARRAEQALSGIVGAVTALDAIATQVAAAVAQQSVATGRIAVAVEGASVAARRTADQVSGMTGLATQCAAGVAVTKDITDKAVQQISGLQGALVGILRARVSELNRRAGERVPVTLPAQLSHEAGTMVGTVRDLSPGGVWFIGSAPPLTTGRLQLAGLPEVAVRVAGRTEDGLHLSFEFTSEEQGQRVAAAVTRLLAAGGLNEAGQPARAA
jgi:methyl-accepting chemotaxis protein